MEQRPILGMWSLALISASAIIALRNLPLMAVHGVASVTFYALAAILFFIPIALVCAELATGWPDRGGVYLWVKEAFGPRTGQMANWLHWIESVVWLPSVLTFIATTAAYMVNPALAKDHYFVLSAILVVLWGGTFINFFGMKASSLVSNVGVGLGTIVPGIIMIALAAAWVLTGQSIATEVSMAAAIPKLNIGNLVFFNGVLLGFAGMEVAAYHAREAIDPQRTYPKAILLSAIIILGISVLGSLAIALVVPRAEISISSGVMQALANFFAAFGFDNMVPVIAFLMVLGGLALVNTWLIGPSKGLLVSREANILPKILCKENKFGVPTNILLLQGFVATFISVLFSIFDNVDYVYWVINTMASQLIALMYIMIFLAAFLLRYRQPHVKRTFRVPGGNFGMAVICCMGIAACVGSLILGFFPPDDIEVASPMMHAFTIFASIIVFSLPPLIWQRRLALHNR